MFAQMASTAAGVAVGSAVGHTVGAAVTGAMSGGSSSAEAAPAQAAAPVDYGAPMQQQQQQPQVCQFEFEQFLRCVEDNGNDIGRCQAYKDILNGCKREHGAY